jgi:hypothetical protein
MADAPSPKPLQSDRIRHWGRAWLLGGIFLLAFGLRLWAPPWQVPSALYTDEGKYVLAAERSAQGAQGQDEEPTDFRNPSLFRHLLNLEYRLVSLLSPSEPVDEVGAGRGLPARRLFIARLTVALLGAAAAVVLYFVGRQAFGPRTGLLAAVLFAINFLHVHLSHFSLNDVPATLFMVAALLPSVGLIRRPSRRGFLLAGLFGGLAIATKYNLGVVLAVPLTVWAVHLARRTVQGDLVVLGPALLGVGALAGVFLGMPDIVWSSAEVREGIARQVNIGDRRWLGQEPAPVLLLYGKALLQAFGAVGLLAALAGLALLARRTPTVGLALAGCPLIYLGYMGGKALFFARFALPLVPFGCLFAAYGLAWLWSRLEARQGAAALALAAGLAVIGPSAVLSARLAWLTGQADTRELAKSWLLASVPPGSKIAAQTYSLPYELAGGDLSRSYGLTFFTRFTEAHRLRELACAGNRYVLVSSFRWEREQMPVQRGQPSGYEALRERGQLQATFRPGPMDSEVPLNIDDVGLPFWEVVRYARPGPTIHVYALPPDACA